MKLEVIEKRQKNDINDIEKKLRVAAYVRVSSREQDQLESFESQVTYFYNRIRNNPNWELIKVYSDEGISGTSTNNRKGFNEMIEDGVNGKFDLLLTKSVSRFARNTLDTLKHVRLLKEYNVSVLFEEENINTGNMQGELLLSILSSIAQQESLNLSEHVQLGLRMKMERGEIVGHCGCFGYDYDINTKQLYINEAEAKIVRLVFGLYAEGVPIRTIAKKLGELGIPSPKGKEKWHHNCISKMLRNEKYAGDLLMGKYYTVPSTVGKQIRNRGYKNKYYIKNHHEPIIDKETYDKVLNRFEEYERLYNTDKKLTGSFLLRYTFSGRIKCYYCGSTMHRATGYKNKSYMCRKSQEEKKDACPRCRLQKEEVLKDVFVQTVKELNKFLEKSRDNYIQYAKEKLKELSSEISNKFSDKLFIGLIDYMIIGSERSPFEIHYILKRNDKRDDITGKPLEYFQNKKFKDLFSFNYSTPFKYYELGENKRNKKEVIVTKIPVTVQIEVGKNSED